MHAGVDLVLVDKIVNEVKSQGVFDQFRKDSMADVDTKPAYQNLRQRVEMSVSKFLAEQRWKSDLNKFQLREKLRKHIVDAGFLDTGVERIVDQVVNPKISAVFQPKIEDIAYKYLGIEKPRISPKISGLNGSLDIKTDLLPTDLEAVSPDSDKTKSESKEDIFNESNEDKNEEFESPPFEPLESEVISNPLKKEESDNSQLSGISGLTSQDSLSSNHKVNTPPSKYVISTDTQQPESQLSEVSSNSRLSIVTNDENSEATKSMVNKPADVDISEEAQMPKFNENSGEAKISHDLHFDIKREDIKFEGTERKVNGDIFRFAHCREDGMKHDVNIQEIDIKSESVLDTQVKGEESIKQESTIKTEDPLADSVSTRNSFIIDEEKNDCMAIDMSLSENESSRDSNSSASTSRNKKSSDMQSNESRVGVFRPRPPSPPNDYMLQKPPSPNYYMLPVPPPPPTPPLPPPPGDDSYMQPPLPPLDHNMMPPLPPVDSIRPPKPPSPELPPLPPTPPPPGEEPPLPGIARPSAESAMFKPPSLPPLPPGDEVQPPQISKPLDRTAMSSLESFVHSLNGNITLPTAPPPPPPPPPLPQEQTKPLSPNLIKDELMTNTSRELAPSPSSPPSPKEFMQQKVSDMEKDLMERMKQYVPTSSSRGTLYKSSAGHASPSSETQCNLPRTQQLSSEFDSPSATHRPPSPKEPFISSSSNQYSNSYNRLSPLNDDYINSPSPPPYEELRPDSPSFDHKSISSKEASFSLSETSQNETISKPPSPFSSKQKGSSSSRDHETLSRPPASESKFGTELKLHTDLRPPSPPPQSKSDSKNTDHNSKSSSSRHSHHHQHRSSKASRDEKNSNKSRCHSSSSRANSSSHRSTDDKKHSSSSSSSSSSKHKSSSKSRDKDRERDKDKNRNKQDDHSSVRHKERRRKSTDSNDGDNHRHGSKHSSSTSTNRHTYEKSSHSSTAKESTSNSNSSGNFSSNSNSCNNGAQAHSSLSRSSSKRKELQRNRNKDEQLRYFIISDEEKRRMDSLIMKLTAAIQSSTEPLYLLNCDENMLIEFQQLSNRVFNVNDENNKDKEIKPADASQNTLKHKEIVMKTSNDCKSLKNNISRKRKIENSYRLPYKSAHNTESDKLVNEATCLIVDCIQYDKPSKVTRTNGDRVDVSPSSSDISVSSKENEFVDGKLLAKKNVSQNMKNGKLIKAEGIVHIEKSGNGNGFKMKSQRYSSEDLYKPKPLSQRPRRRDLLTDTDMV